MYSFFFLSYIWKAWVSTPFPHSLPPLPHCWAVFIGDREHGDRCAVSPRCSAEKRILLHSVCSQGAAEQGGRLTVSFRPCVTFVILPSYMWRLSKRLWDSGVRRDCQSNRTAGCPMGQIDGLMDSMRWDEAFRLSLATHSHSIVKLYGWIPW